MEALAILPGLLDDQKEFLGHTGSLYCISGGSITQIPSLPTLFISLIKTEINMNSKIQAGLSKLNITNPSEQVIKFYNCNYSDCDNRPDIDHDDQLGPREYVSCPNRGNCPAEGLLCSIPFGFSKRERDVVREIGLGLLDKEICDKLGISQDTLRNHKDSACEKAGIERKVSLGIIAHQYKLV